MNIGLVQVYTGDGKGKTTAAVGQAIRAIGRGFKVIFIQFLKGDDTGEVVFIEKNIPEIKLFRFNSQKKFIWTMNDTEKEILRADTVKGFEFIKKIIMDDYCDMLILDEIIWALNEGFIQFTDLKNYISMRPSSMEIILTGRKASKELIKFADLVTEMRNIKHPYDKGITARLGIEK